jgi:hypothetical protein
MASWGPSQARQTHAGSGPCLAPATGDHACYRCATDGAWCAEKWNEDAALTVGIRGLKSLDRTIQNARFGGAS